MSGKSFHVIVPAYHEAKSVEHLRLLDRKLSGSEKSYKLSLVDDGSGDGTYGELAELASDRENVTASGYSKNRGKGYAIRKGIRMIEDQPDYVLFFDADGDITPSSLLELIERAESTDADVLAGSKWHDDSCVYYPLSRVMLSRVFSFFTRLYLGLDVRDTQSGLKAVRYDVLEDLIPDSRVDGYAFDTELIYLAKTNSYSVVEVPLHLEYGDESSLDLFDMAKIFRDTVLTRLRHG